MWKKKQPKVEHSREFRMTRLIDHGLLPKANFAYAVNDEYPVFKAELHDMLNDLVLDIENSKAHRYFDVLDFAIQQGEKKLEKRLENKEQ
jgi:hypothetical protein